MHLVGGEQPRRVGRHDLRGLLLRLTERSEDQRHRVTAAIVIREVIPEVRLDLVLVVQGLLGPRASAHVAVLLADDLLATGGTAAAALHLIEQAGGKVLGSTFFIELAFLGGREKVSDSGPVHSLITY